MFLHYYYWCWLLRRFIIIILMFSAYFAFTWYIYYCHYYWLRILFVIIIRWCLRHIIFAYAYAADYIIIRLRLIFILAIATLHWYFISFSFMIHYSLLFTILLVIMPGYFGFHITLSNISLLLRCFSLRLRHWCFIIAHISHYFLFITYITHYQIHILPILFRFLLPRYCHFSSLVIFIVITLIFHIATYYHYITLWPLHYAIFHYFYVLLPLLFHSFSSYCHCHFHTHDWLLMAFIFSSLILDLFIRSSFQYFILLLISSPATLWYWLFSLLDFIVATYFIAEVSHCTRHWYFAID